MDDEGSKLLTCVPIYDGEYIDDDETEDYYRRQYEHRTRLLSVAIKEGKWITKDGDRLLITRMRTSHILNCLQWLNRNQDYPFANEYVMLFGAALNDRGECGEGIVRI